MPIKIFFLNAIISFSCSGVGGVPCLIIAALILFIFAAQGRLMVKPMMKAMNAIDAPVVSTLAYQLVNQIELKPAESFHINKNPERMVMIADIIAAIG